MKDQASGSTYDRMYWHPSTALRTGGLGGEVLMESDLSGGNQTEHIYFNGQRIAKRNPDGQVYFFFDDHLGNTRVATTSSGTVLDEFDPYPHGWFRTISFTSGDWHLFTDHEYDPDTGLHYMRARHYAFSLGRFLQPDEFTGGPVDAFSSNDPLPPGPLPYAEITNPQSLNKYTYVLNNPLVYVDPNGHELKVADALLATVTKLEKESPTFKAEMDAARNSDKYNVSIGTKDPFQKVADAKVTITSDDTIKVEIKVDPGDEGERGDEKTTQGKRRKERLNDSVSPKGRDLDASTAVIDSLTVFACAVFGACFGRSAPVSRHRTCSQGSS